ncbi:MAG: hypothetical protein L0387_38780 [Acidobacteria bacterium]|nr:hypothetical protein [Acidobacteriota bacterium]MCI0723134.1 hypothetical protein [Acidobacteriota bacterium]
MTTRRTFIQNLMGLSAASTTASAAIHVHRFDPVGQRMAAGKVEEKAAHPCEAEHRQAMAMKLREQCARHQCQRPLPDQLANGDEVNLPWTAVPSAVTGNSPSAVNTSGQVTPGCIFRGRSFGDLTGHYLSQFLWKPVPCGSGKSGQRYRILTGRDVAEYVHFDFLYQAFLNAAVILENVGPETEPDLAILSDIGVPVTSSISS